MKKVLLLIASLLFLTGCYTELIKATPKVRYIQNYGKFEFFVDKETCVEYIEDYTSHGLGFIPRLNADGTLILNEVCLKTKMD